MALPHRLVRFEGVHCSLEIQKRHPRIVLVKITGPDVGEFGHAPMKAIDECLGSPSRIDLFIDARDVRGASIEVSGEWAGWLTARRESLRTVTMLTGSRLIHVTAEFVRRFASLEGNMRICTDPGVFDRSLQQAMSA